jgi:protein-disulfide isomerase
VVRIKTEEEAHALGMRGSPTVIVNGDDVDPRARGTQTMFHA